MIFLSAFSSCKKDFTAIENASIVDNTGENFDKLNANGSRPNIILIIADDVDYEIPTFAGGQSYNTPNLDVMAQNGIQFNQAYCHPDGFPSRLAALSGKYYFSNYI